MTIPQPLSWKIRLAIFIPLMAMGSMPLFVYFRFEHESILLLMWLTLIVVQFVLSIRTARLAIGMMTGVRKRDGKHVYIDMTVEEAKAYPRKVLVTVFRATWLEHVMLALPRLGGAIGWTAFWGWAYTIPFLVEPPLLLGKARIFVRPFLYVNGYEAQTRSDWTQVVLALIVLIIFAIAECLFGSAMGVIIATVSRRTKATLQLMTYRVVTIVVVMIAYGLLTLGFIEVEHRIDDVISLRSNEVACDSIYYEAISERGRYRQEDGYKLHAEGVCPQVKFGRFIVLSMESTQVTITSFVDSGMLLSGNILQRQSGSYFISYGFIDTRYNFTVRTILSALLAFGLYGVMIVAMLRVARRRLVRQSEGADRFVYPHSDSVTMFD